MRFARYIEAVRDDGTEWVRYHASKILLTLVERNDIHGCFFFEKQIESTAFGSAATRFRDLVNRFSDDAGIR